MFKNELESLYHKYCQESHGTQEHLPALRQLAMECASATEIGVEFMYSSWAILQGLSESPLPNRSYLGIDLNSPPTETLRRARKITEGVGVFFKFWKANDLFIESLEPTDLLFIDSLHTYYHLSFELQKFSSQVRKYIAIHDTDFPFGFHNELTYSGDYSEYFPNETPPRGSRIKRGLWQAVVDFLGQHPEWVLQEHKFNGNGFTVLKRVVQD